MNNAHPILICPNWGPDSRECRRLGHIPCQECLLVVYCSRSCQADDLARHRAACRHPLNSNTWYPNWVTRHREPRFLNPLIHPSVRKKYWGTIPAIDILKLPFNEGATYQNNLNLLFAASGDLRNVIKTVVELPDTYQQNLEITVCDNDFDIVARNAILLLFLALKPSAVDFHRIADCMIHVWYSTLLRESDVELLNTHIRPMVQEVLERIQHKDLFRLLRKSWTDDESGRTVSIALRRIDWERLIHYFECPTGISKDVATDLRRIVTESPMQRDKRESDLFMRPEKHRLPLSRFRQEGILLPFSASREEFTTPNSTFFIDYEGWRMVEDANPLHGWPSSEVDAIWRGGAAADIYGKLYYYLRATFHKFLVRSIEVNLDISLFCLGIREIPHILGDATKFDRIETSDIADKTDDGLEEIFRAFSLMMRDISVNNHATIITLFTRAIRRTILPEERRNQTSFPTPALARLAQYLHPYRIPRMVTDPEFVGFTVAQELVMSYDAIFRRYMDEKRFHQSSLSHGLVMKHDNTIIPSWPFRLRLEPDQPGAQQEFDQLFASGVNSQERYVEWKIRPSVPPFSP